MAEQAKAKQIQVAIPVTVNEDIVLMLHEEVATGTINASPVRVIRSINGATTHIQFKGKSYMINTMDLVRAVLDRVENTDVRA